MKIIINHNGKDIEVNNVRVLIDGKEFDLSESFDGRLVVQKVREDDNNNRNISVHPHCMEAIGIS
jgi:hypothetical protein